MGKQLEQLGLQLGGQAASSAQAGIFGAIFGKGADRRQYQLQEKMQRLGIEGAKEMADYNYQRELQMWKDTNYSAQVEQLKAAGLNPGLLYGMGGGGGTTTGTPSTGIPEGSAGRSGPVLGMGINVAELALLKAQKENIEADTANKRADIPVKGATVPKIEAETAGITQGIENQKAQQRLTEIQQKIGQLDVNFLEGTLQNRMSKINIELSKAIEEVQILGNERLISDATVKTKIGLIKLEYANKVLEGIKTQAQTGLINEQTKEVINSIQMKIQENMRQWDKLSLETQTTNLDNLIKMNDDADLNKDIKDMLNNILIMPRIGGKTGHTPITGFTPKK